MGMQLRACQKRSFRGIRDLEMTSSGIVDERGMYLEGLFLSSNNTTYTEVAEA